MRIMALLDGSGIVTNKAYENAIADFAGWIDISETPWVEEGRNLATQILELEKKVKTEELGRAYESHIVSGFLSSALGAAHSYQSDLEAQLNLVGSTAAGVSIPYQCTDANGVTATRIHTAEQMKQLLMDGANVKINALAKLRNLRGAVLSATSVNEVRAIVW